SRTRLPKYRRGWMTCISVPNPLAFRTVLRRTPTGAPVGVAVVERSTSNSYSPGWLPAMIHPCTGFLLGVGDVGRPAGAGGGAGPGPPRPGGPSGGGGAGGAGGGGGGAPGRRRAGGGRRGGRA